METTERIVEAYVRYVKGWATIPNIRCDDQSEIDLLAIDPRPHGERYHIEIGVSISGAYSKLTDKEFSIEALRTRVKQAGQRRTLDYFIKRKFEPESVVTKLREYGFRPGRYEKVIVTWGWTGNVPEKAKRAGVVLWDFRDIIRKIAQKFEDKRSYFSDDTLRTLHLYAHAGVQKEATRREKKTEETIISVVRDLYRKKGNSITTQEVISYVKKKFPYSKINAQHVGWYRAKMREEGILP